MNWGVLLAWQGLSVFISGTGVFSELLSRRGINFPTTQGALNYLLLTGYLLRLWGRWSHTSAAAATSRGSIAVTGADRAGLLCPVYVLHIPWWQYLLLALADVEANYLLVLAYQYTTITSVQLLDCFTIPCVMVLSCVILHARYSWRHLLGALLCICGLCLLVLSDIMGHRFGHGGEQQHNSSDRAFGDMLVLLGAFLYAVSNLGQEYVLKRVSLSQLTSNSSAGGTPRPSAAGEDHDADMGAGIGASQHSQVTVVLGGPGGDEAPLLVPGENAPRYSPTDDSEDATREQSDSSDEAFHVYAVHRSAQDGASPSSVEAGVAVRDNVYTTSDVSCCVRGGERYVNISVTGAAFASDDEARHEYLSQLGLFGSIISAVQMVVLERHRWVEAHLDWVSLLYVAGYTTCLFTLYVGASALIQRSSVLVMNLSFLTADFYAVIMALLLFDAQLNALYFVAFTVIVGGLVLYHTAPAPPATPKSTVASDS